MNFSTLYLNMVFYNRTSIKEKKTIVINYFCLENRGLGLFTHKINMPIEEFYKKNI